MLAQGIKAGTDGWADKWAIRSFVAVLASRSLWLVHFQGFFLRQEKKKKKNSLFPAKAGAASRTETRKQFTRHVQADALTCLVDPPLVVAPFLAVHAQLVVTRSACFDDIATTLRLPSDVGAMANLQPASARILANL